MIGAAWESKAVVAVAPLQDILGLGTEARMNYPGTLDGNWAWRLAEGAFDGTVRARLAALNLATGR